MNYPRWVKHRTKDLVQGETALYARMDVLEGNVEYLGLVVTSNKDGKFYISPADKNHAATGDRRGPFETLEEACSAADTIIGLNAVPREWGGT